MIAWLKPLCPCVGLAQLYSSLTMRGWHCHKVRSLCCSFECKSDGTYLDINHVSLEKTDEEPEESQYTGPVSMPMCTAACRIRCTSDNVCTWFWHFVIRRSPGSADQCILEDMLLDLSI